jgi:hypothetical protein
LIAGPFRAQPGNPPCQLLPVAAALYVRGMENPYQSPESPPNFAGVDFGSPFADHIPSGKASQVPVVAVLMMVQGGFELLYAAFMLAMAVVMPLVMSGVPQNQPGAPQGPGPAVMGWTIGGVYLVMGGAMLLFGLLKLVAGFRNYRYRNRTLGIVALVSGLATVAGCYCLPTATMLLIYGLIVYLDPQTAYAFRLGDQGQSPELIKALLDRYR